MPTTNDRIAEYLRTKGRMSSSDICDDLDVSPVDVQWAAADSACPVESCTPEPGGVSPWYRHYDGKQQPKPEDD